MTNRARKVATGAAYGGGAAGAVGVLGWLVLRAEARLARRTIGTPVGTAPESSGRYGRGRGAPLRMALLGDSSAAGLGCELPEQTPGALLAGSLARELQRRVELDVLAVTGARAADLGPQVARAALRKPHLALVMVGANDVTHRVPPAAAARDLALAVRTLRAVGAQVVVGTCPDLGTVKPVMQPLRTYARFRSREMAQAQTVAAVEEGALTVSLGDLLGPLFAEDERLWSADRFHPSAEGYARLADVLLPSLLEALGAPAERVVTEVVQDVEVAAGVASLEPGTEVETVPGEEGAAAAGPGRLARLVRRLPLVGRGAPEQRTGDLPDPEQRAGVPGSASEDDAAVDDAG